MNRPRFHEPPLVARIPQVPEPPLSTCAFALLPPCMLQGLPAEWAAGLASLYRIALKQAQAVLRPSLPERDLLAVWN